jgi:hypothetical protein
MADLGQLHDSEINAGVQTFYDAGMRIRIGDEMIGLHAETTIIGHPPAASSGRKGSLWRVGCKRPRYVCTPIEERRIANAQNSRLCGLPDENCFTKAPTKPSKPAKD